MSALNYLQKLLNKSEVEWKTLGEIGEVRMCKRILKSQTTSDGEIPFYKIGTFGKKPDAYISRKLFDELENLRYRYLFLSLPRNHVPNKPESSEFWMLLPLLPLNLTPSLPCVKSSTTTIASSY